MSFWFLHFPFACYYFFLFHCVVLLLFVIVLLCLACFNIFICIFGAAFSSTGTKLCVAIRINRTSGQTDRLSLSGLNQGLSICVMPRDSFISHSTSNVNYTQHPLATSNTSASASTPDLAAVNTYISDYILLHISSGDNWTGSAREIIQSTPMWIRAWTDGTSTPF